MTIERREMGEEEGREEIVKEDKDERERWTMVLSKEW